MRAIAVLMPPGWTAVTPTWWPATSISSRIASVMPRTAYFDALYMHWPGIEISPKSEEMLTRWPSPESIRCGRNSFVPCTTPQKFTPMIQSMSFISRSTKLPASATPALLTTTLTRPNSCDHASAYAANASRSATSRRSLRTSGAPAFSASATVSASPSSSTSDSASRAPLRARSSASARPMPEPAPVMTTTLSFSDFMRVPPRQR